MATLLVRFIRDRTGATAIEYGIIASVISITIVLAATAIGTRLNGMLGAAADHFN